jgi:hypothetical protein
VHGFGHSDEVRIDPARRDAEGCAGCLGELALLPLFLGGRGGKRRERRSNRRNLEESDRRAVEGDHRTVRAARHELLPPADRPGSALAVEPVVVLDAAIHHVDENLRVAGID